MVINVPCRTAFAPLTTWQDRRLALTWPDLREENVLLAGSRADAASLRGHPGLMMTRMVMMMHAHAASGLAPSKGATVRPLMDVWRERMALQSRWRPENLKWSMENLLPGVRSDTGDEVN